MDTGEKKRTMEREQDREHILVCLSASPSNAKIVRTAAKMAQAFQGAFTALYVKTPEEERMDEANKKRLLENRRLAEQFGADISTVYGDDASYQIAEFARISGVTKIVIGRSSVKRHHFWSKPPLTEKLIKMAPNLDIYIIPDTASRNRYYERKQKIFSHLRPSAGDFMTTLGILAMASGIGTVFWDLGFTEANIITVYILAVLLTALFTRGYFCSVLSALSGVLLFSFFFTEPRLTFHAYEKGYPVTFGIMLTAALITGTLANKLKNHAKQSAQSAFRTKVLFDTNQLLHKAQDEKDIMNITASQLMKLLERDIVIYPETGGRLCKGYLFHCLETEEKDFSAFSGKNAAEWTFRNRERAGAGTDHFGKDGNLYLPIYINQKVYGVLGICIGNRMLDSFENSVVLAILGECALAVENIRNAREKEKAAILAQKEQLRANLLRAISHDLRTPLTSISGNASNLLSNYRQLDDEIRMQMFTDIYDDSQWLISLVENLLSVTRIEEGRLNFHMTTELMEEVIEEALRHINRKKTEHEISVEYKEELLLAKMDAKLILQVLINLVDNAIKYTPAGSQIRISTEKIEDRIAVSIADNGAGIPDEMKPRVFEMFFTGENKIVDSRRSLGLGLSLCRSIISAHGGELVLTDNEPHGCIFTFTLHSGEVPINEESNDTCGGG